MSSLVCPNCNYQAEDNETFCSKCGTKLISVQRKANCSNCGSILKPEAVFCSKCGAKRLNNGTSPGNQLFCKNETENGTEDQRTNETDKSKKEQPKTKKDNQSKSLNNGITFSSEKTGAVNASTIISAVIGLVIALIMIVLAYLAGYYDWFNLIDTGPLAL